MSDTVDLEQLRALECAIASLPWLQRKVFLMRQVDRFSYAEIAFLTRLSERYIERQMAKAIARLTRQMEGERLSWWERLW